MNKNYEHCRPNPANKHSFILGTKQLYRWHLPPVFFIPGIGWVNRFLSEFCGHIFFYEGQADGCVPSYHHDTSWQNL